MKRFHTIEKTNFYYYLSDPLIMFAPSSLLTLYIFFEWTVIKWEKGNLMVHKIVLKLEKGCVNYNITSKTHESHYTIQHSKQEHGN